MAQHREDYEQAARQYQRALNIFDWLGDQGGMARTISELGILYAARSASPAAVITRHVKAIAIRLRSGIPEAAPT